VRVRTVATSFLFTASLGCGRDRSITHGADGSPEWTRRLTAAVPLGVARDSAQAMLERNGFRCERDSVRTASLWCEKESGGRFAIVRRRWQAMITIQDGHVAAVQATTGLIGP
jgi:hypothetical protein